MPDLLQAAAPQSDVTTAGYLVVDRAGVALVDSLSFAADGTPQLFGGESNRIWLGPGSETILKDQLQAGAGFQYATARVRGRLEGPAAYGTGGSYRYQMASPRIELIAAQETTIADLIEQSASHEDQLVRLIGGLIARDSSALLAEQIGVGGLPEPKARQIKLRAPIRDGALLDRLHGVPGGAIRFGRVQIEGFWHDGMLIPLSITPVI
jgi:hypothetical protein